MSMTASDIKYFAKQKAKVVKRRYCPVCRQFRIGPGEPRCDCGVLASSAFPVFVDVNAEEGDR